MKFMYIKKINILLLIIGVVLLSGCSSFDLSNSTLGGDQSPMGEVGNECRVTVPFSGVQDAKVVVTDLEDGVSTTSYSVKITNPTLLEIAQSMSDVKIKNGVATAKRQYRITENGYQSVYDEGDLTIVDYNSKVGDKYSLKRGNTTIRREVVSKSTKDDYAWGGFNIKTINVEEKGRNLPGVDKIEFIANHKWGMVGIKIYFEDGTTSIIGITSDASN
jgi:hypothetical protein